MLVAVEVKTGTAPLAHFTSEKIASVRAAMAMLEPHPQRLDLVTIVPGVGRMTVRWSRGADHRP